MFGLFVDKLGRFIIMIEVNLEMMLFSHVIVINRVPSTNKQFSTFSNETGIFKQLSFSNSPWFCQILHKIATFPTSHRGKIAVIQYRKEIFILTLSDYNHRCMS